MRDKASIAWLSIPLFAMRRRHLLARRSEWCSFALTLASNGQTAENFSHSILAV